MSLYHRSISCLLLILFLRVMLPDSLVLALHRHTHTTEKRLEHKAGARQLDVKHTHCPTDHLFNTSFFGHQAPVILPLLLVFAPSLPAPYRQVWKFTYPQSYTLRGPPSC